METKYGNLFNGEKFYAIKCEGQTIARFPAYIDSNNSTLYLSFAILQ